MNTVTILAFTFSAAAFGVSVFSLALNPTFRHRIRSYGDNINTSLIKSDALLDQRSFFQSALRTMTLALETGEASHAEAALRVVRLLVGNPILCASPVLPDMQLAQYEASVETGTVWVVSADESIEFAYPELGGNFSSVVSANLLRGVTYRYLVPASEATRERRVAIREGFGNIDIRFLNRAYWDKAEEFASEFVIYESGTSLEDASGFFLYPGSTPKRWIRMDQHSVRSRLSDAKVQWELSD
jgi:hypothetical protein